MIRFLKDHLNYKAGTEIENHPNEAYLIVLGVAERVPEKKEHHTFKEKVEHIFSKKEKVVKKKK